jgi:spore coat protein U-like protein
MNIRRIGIAILLLGGAASAALAGTATSNVTVSATVVANCTISTASLSFTGYDPVVANAAVPLDTTGSLVVACTKGAAATIGLSQGAHPFAGSTINAPLRQVLSPTTSNNIRYDFYQDAARTNIWGDVGSGATKTQAYNSVSKTATTLTIYGRMPAGQDVSVAADYADTVVATINF